MKNVRIIFSLSACAAVFLFLCTSFSLQALNPDKAITQYSMYVWNLEGGLPSNAVYAICQTRDGYLWIGTGEGLARFDGLNFDIYNIKNTPQLRNNTIRALCEDSSDTLWIGTDAGGLTRYKDGDFFTYPVSEHKVLDKIRTINEDRWGNLWIGTVSQGATCLHGERFTTYTTKEGLPANLVNNIYKDSAGELWITTIAGIVKLKEPGDFEPIVSNKDVPHFMFSCLYMADKEELWIGSSRGRLYRWKKGKITPFGPKEGLSNQTINFLYRDRNNILWIGTDGGGLTRMSNGKFTTLPGGNGLVSGFVQTIFEDREGSLWLGELDGGLYQLKDSKFTTYTRREGLVDNFINCVSESQAGGIWVGSRGGLNLLKHKTLTPSSVAETLLVSDRVVCLYEDPEKCLWIGTWGRGLHRFKDGKLAPLTTREGLSQYTIADIYRDKQGSTWISTEGGLNRLDKKNGELAVFTTADGLSSNDIDFVFEDSRGHIWVGTHSGLDRFKDGLFTAYRPEAGFADKDFLCAYEDIEGILWFGTKSGLIRLQEDRPTFYTEQSGLIENYVFSILEDEKGYLWLGGQNGVSRIRKEELADYVAGEINRVHPDAYNEGDGMKSRWCNGTGCKTRDGRFWFPTAIGVAVIDPNQVEKSKNHPPLMIDKLIVDDEAVDLFPGTTKQETIELSPGKRRFEFHYTAPSFINPQRIRFKIKLAGYDRDWLDMAGVRSTTYTGLPPRSYTFRVTACNADGIWNEEGASLSFYLKPYFTQTKWFILLIILVVLLTGYSFYRYRVGQLRKREKELSALVEVRTKDLKERTIELEIAHQNLKESNDIIETKNRNIMDSMRYARRIQQAMLPVNEKIAKELRHYFVIYRPRDIVSGDFYWFDAFEDYYFLAVADCTGHGVPGALLSMIGCMRLNEVVGVGHVIDPAAALFHLHQGFRTVLKQEFGETDTYDGMDVALVRIHRKTGQVTFAGARRPLYYMNGTELVEIKGDRKSIGGRQKEKKRFFTNHEIDIPVTKGDEIMLYMSTDGFVDQNNPHNKKYGSRRFRQFLAQHAHLSAAKQGDKLLEELKKHMGDEEQRDDITVVGVRVRKP